MKVIKNIVIIIMLFFCGIMVDGTKSYAANTSKQTALQIQFDKEYNDTLDSSRDKRFYKFTIDSPGNISFTSEGDIDKYSAYLYSDDSDDYIVGRIESRNNVSQRAYLSRSADLTQGTYYIGVYSEYSPSGTFKLTVSFTPSGETFPESDHGSNNDITKANTIAFDQTITSQIAYNDNYDCFKFDVPSTGIITLSMEAAIDELKIGIFDPKGNLINWLTGYSNKVTNKIVFDEKYYLQKGIYYLRLRKWNNYTGVAKFKLKFESANESFEENGADDKISGANKILNNVLYRGQLSENHEDEDYYMFTVPENVIISLDIWSNGIGYYYIYDLNGNTMISDNIYYEESGVYTVTRNLSSGTYYFRLKGKSSSERGNYSFKINEYSAPANVVQKNIKNKKKKKIVVNWKTVEGATGYEINISNSKKFKKYDYYYTKSNKYTLKCAKAKKKYYVRVRAYKKIGDYYLDGNWSNVKSVKTKK